jgi:GntR family transcriptional regulator
MPRSESMMIGSLEIDRDSPVPIYHQVEQELTHLIDSGILPPGRRLPSETELAAMLGISPMTARQALCELERNGLIRRQRGVGSFVQGRLYDRSIEQLMGFTEDMSSRGLIPSARILRFEQSVVPAAAVAESAVEAGTPMLRIKRLRLANDQPVALQDSWFSDADFTRDELEASGSVYRLLEARGKRMVRAEALMRVVSAEAEEAHLLQLPLHSPLLQTRVFHWDERDQFAEYTASFFRADLYVFRAKLGRW